MSIDCNGGHAFGASHCSPEWCTVVATPPAPSSPLALSAWTTVAATSSLARPAQSGAAKSASVGEGATPSSMSLVSQRSVQRPSSGCHIRAAMAARRRSAACASSTALLVLKPRPATNDASTSVSRTPVATASESAAKVSSRRYMMAFKSTGTTRVVAVSRKRKAPPTLLPDRVHREEKSQPVSAAVESSRYPAALPPDVSRSSLYDSGRAAFEVA
mmetsp:Transcript_13998/g.32917  ORF Transcript_13998/g.32917 Transcript_13998/m.32917 type:complete len:216 (+) Transcript_13998:573-1220(+)